MFEHSYSHSFVCTIDLCKDIIEQIFSLLTAKIFDGITDILLAKMHFDSVGTGCEVTLRYWKRKK